jgi:hypothetical protein
MLSSIFLKISKFTWVDLQILQIKFSLFPAI